MKIYIKHVFIALLALSCSACSDILDQYPPDQKTSGNFWENTQAAEYGLASAYSQLESSNGEYYLGEVRYTVEPYREDMILSGPDANNYGHWLQLYEFTYDNSNTQFAVYWEDNYRGILFANEVMAKVPNIDNMDPAYRDQIAAEATFLRAYYHLKLLLNWKEIIVRDEYVVKDSELPKALSSRTEAWDFIIADLETATKNEKLPLVQKKEHAGRITRGTAYAYLGYCYLTRAYEEPSKKSEYLQKAESAFKEIKGYDLVNDFLSLFNGTNKNSVESLFEIQFTENTASGAMYQHRLHKFVGCYQLGGWGGIAPSPRLLEEFKKEGKIATTGRYDTRAYKTLYFRDDYFSDPSTEMVYGYKFEEVFEDSSVEYIEFRKYLPPTETTLYNRRSSTNIPLMRYADVLLLLAETLNEQGKTSEAIPLINRVRARADMPAITGTTQDQVREQIEHERIVEFALENTRFYDLRRWGKTKEALHAIGRTKFDPNKHNFYPIPQSEINSNNALK